MKQFLVITIIFFLIYPSIACKDSNESTDYINLPKKYTLQMALKNGDVVSTNEYGKYKNFKTFLHFLNNIKKGQSDTTRITDFYNSEDGPIITTLNYDGKYIICYLDQTREKYGGKEIIEIKGDRINTFVEKKIDESDSYKLIKRIVYYLKDSKNQQADYPILEVEKKLKRVPVEKTVKTDTKTFKHDLNGDNNLDTILFRFIHRTIDKVPIEPDFDSIIINNISKKINITGYPDIIKIIDLDRSDKFKEIVYGYYDGECESGSTEFFYFNGKHIISIGSFESSFKDMKFNGTGILKVVAESKLIPFWGIEELHRISKSHFLEKIPLDYYNIIFDSIKVSENLPLQKSPTNPQIKTILKPGDKVRFTKTDNKMWCQVKNKQGVRGWFGVSGEYAGTTVIGTGKSIKVYFSDLTHYEH